MILRGLLSQGAEMVFRRVRMRRDFMKNKKIEKFLKIFLRLKMPLKV